MQIRNAQYLSGCTSVDKCPAPILPEYAFIGRSNVGKSSLINMITGYKKLAKISSTPGKTRIINHFLIDESWYLVDLPGYGFARISKKDRLAWEGMINEYLLKRLNLLCVFLLVDARIKPQASDIRMMDWLAAANKPFVILFTKTDKLSRNELGIKMQEYQKHLLDEWELPPQSIITSATTNLGKAEILEFIGEQNAKYSPGS
ncbi:MAG: ribosome biogenesis GTP-binding protein YihA/YsxC [Bacteroidales bacterium]|nr:ribosome biogenesis GTP-binding protein YihA/YsxC [Bacteroidales bacterium]